MKTKKISGFLAVLCIFAVMLPSTIFAAEASQEGLRATLTTGAESYTQAENIQATLTVTNENAYAVEGVELKALVPEGYELADESQQGEMKVDSLAAGESVQLAVELKNTAAVEETTDEATVDEAKGAAKTEEETTIAPKKAKEEVDTKKAEDTTNTGDNQNMVLWIAVFVLCVAGILGIGTKNKKGKSFLSKFLCMVLVTAAVFESGVTMASATETAEKKTFTVSQDVTVDGQKITLSAEVSYLPYEEDVESTTITREEWISYLMQVLEQPALTDVQFSFDDSENADEPSVLEAAIQCGVLDAQPDGDNMVYVNPKQVATREFIAYTAVRALGYQLSETDAPAWTDAAELAYVNEDVKAVDLGIIKLIDEAFQPNAVITEKALRNAKSVIEEIIAGGSAGGSGNPVVNYADGVTETYATYEVNQDAMTVLIPGTEYAFDWAAGEVHVLRHEEDATQDIAIKIASIEVNGENTLIHYTEPELSEVVKDFDMEGTESESGTFTPAEGVTIENTELAYARARAAASGSVSLFGKKKVSLNIEMQNGKTSTVTVGLDMKNLEYRFVASPSAHIVNIDEAYLALNSSVDIECAYKKEYVSSPSEEADEIKLGDFNVPLGYGFNASGEIYLTYSVEGGFSISYTVNSKLGVQYSDGNGIRSVSRISTEGPDLKANGSAKIGVDVQPGAEFLGIDLISVGIEAGEAVDGSLSNVNLLTAPPEFCLDAILYLYTTIYAQIGPDALNLRLEREIFNSDNSILKKNLHFEETGRVAECTRGYGNYQGNVVRADNTSIPVQRAKIQVYKGNRIKDTTYADAYGKFVGISLPAGTYKIRVSAFGYRPYEQQFDVIGGETTTLETQLMISNADDGQEGTIGCSGTIINALTGRPVEGATVTVKTQYFMGNFAGINQVIDEVTTDANGNYSFNAARGKYLLEVTKDGFEKNTRNVTLINNDLTQQNVTINPVAGEIITGERLRVVLSWGEYPRDLDSHMVGPKGNSKFHVFYWYKNADNANLDVDDVTSYGPETVTITEKENGIYHYYVHDFTNRSSNNSKELSNSGATVQIYDGNTLKYTIHVPTDKEGTLWHVFDYNSTTGRITLFNEFSYEKDPRDVGQDADVTGTGSGSGRAFAIPQYQDIEKDYEKETAVTEEQTTEDTPEATTQKPQIEAVVEATTQKPQIEAVVEETTQESEVADAEEETTTGEEVTEASAE